MTRKLVVIILVLVTAVSVAGYFATRANSAGMVLTGIVTTDQVVVSTQIAGRLDQVDVREGDSVSAGQLLAVIAPKELRAGEAFYAATMKGSQAQVEVAQAALKYQELQTRDQLRQAMIDLVRVNSSRSCYIRPLVFRGYGNLGVSPLKNPVEIYLLAWKWGKYLGDEALKQGVDVCVSSWNRIAPNTLPAMAKAAANYMNAQLIKMEAITNGYVEGIALDHGGNISEGSGENIFVVRNGTIYTPPLGSSVLPGITRASIIQLAEEAGIPVIEQVLAREILYIADEVFFSGTAAEVTPVRSVDRIVVGKGQPGPITRKMQERYLDIVEGRVEDKFGWLTFSNQPVASSR